MLIPSYSPAMSLLTLEVEIDHGRVFPRGSSVLPEKGTGLLTLFPEGGTKPIASGAVRGFIRQWAGAFSTPADDGDPRLAYLLGKHVK